MNTKTYLASWYNYHVMQYVEIQAYNIADAEEKALKLVNRDAGDTLYSFKIYKLVRTIKQDGKRNPSINYIDE